MEDCQMKNRSNNRNEFYVYKVVRQTETTPEETTNVATPEKPDNTNYVISPHFGKQEYKKYYESMGYHKDPSSYDFIRGDKKLRYDTYKKYVNNNQPEQRITENVEVEKVEINVEPQNTSVKNEQYQDDYYKDDYSSYVVSEEETNTIDDIPEDVFVYDHHVNIRKFSGQPAKKVETPKPVQQVVIAQPEDKPKQPINVGPKPSKYVGPKMEFLSHTKEANNENVAEAERQKAVINRTFQESGIRASVSEYIFGPTVTQFFIKVEPGVNVKSIQSVESNLTMYLEAESIRLQIPIPGKPFAGIEVPKKRENRKIVHLGDLLDSNEFKNSKMELPIAVGQDNYGTTMYIDIAEMPHCLIAGTTKSGKSVSLNAFLLSLIYKFSPRDLKLVLIDPKRIGLGPYEGIPHLAMPVIP
jgi:S-DNA-T family DNA segregation ATPase FtsK/SpoIIIE